MKKTILFLFISLVLISCASLKTNSDSDALKNEILGLWTEHWGTDLPDSENDVTYVDTIRFELDANNKLQLKCTNRTNYLYDKIKLKGDILTFRMENTAYPGGKFLIYYTLKLTDEKKKFTGKIINSLGKKVNIKLLKLN